MAVILPATPRSFYQHPLRYHESEETIMDERRLADTASKRLLRAARSGVARLARKRLAGQHRSLPLVLEKEGHFFVGGKYFGTPGRQFMAGQMYVEYRIPRRLRRPFPIVMWHGGGQSGACYTGTPDGREGWAQFFLRSGYAVYVVDQPGRGRSAYNPDAYSPQYWRDTSLVQERFTASAQSGVWPHARLHTQWPGAGTAGDPVFDQFYAAQLPMIESSLVQQSLNRDAGAALLDRIGPAILLTHSESGDYGWLIADARPNLVKAIVAAEPSGPPVYNPKFEKGGSSSRPWDGALARPWGVTGQPLTYFPAAANSGEMKFVEQEQADGANLFKCWLQEEPVRELAHLKNVPVLVLTAEASFHAGYDHCTARYLTQAGVNTTFARLPDFGIHGNGHMMMIEKNNLEIAAVIACWLEITLAP
jgi:pimeloyl-ACP methyl ester carboxylesterase